MRILVVCQYYHPEPFRITDICETLAKMGHSVTVLTGLPNYPEGKIHSEYKYRSKRTEWINQVKVLRTFEIGRRKGAFFLFLNYLSFAISGSVSALFLKKEYDIILVNQLSPILMVLPAIVYKACQKKKIMLYCLDLWPDSLTARGVRKGSIIYKVFLVISRWIYRSADEIAVTSNSFINYFNEVLNIKNKPITYLPQYAEDLFESVQFSKHESDLYNFVFAGNIGDVQSVETIIRAAKELSYYKNIEIHIVGEGSRLDECKILANEFALNNVTFYGRRPLEEMIQFYSMADAMLVTLKKNEMLSYTVPGKVQTYMASSKPIIGAIDGETFDVLVNAQCGFVSAAEDYRSLANSILRFTESKEKEKFAINSRNYYLANYSKSNFMDKLEKILMKMEGLSHV